MVYLPMVNVVNIPYMDPTGYGNDSPKAIFFFNFRFGWHLRTFQLSLQYSLTWLAKTSNYFPTKNIHLYGGFLKWWYPTTMGFPAKNDHFGMFWGYHHLGNTHKHLWVYFPILVYQRLKKKWTCQTPPNWLDFAHCIETFCRELLPPPHFQGSIVDL